MKQKQTIRVDLTSRFELWRAAWRRLFGYDFFISYAWLDGRPYAEALEHALGTQPQKYRCFIDQKEMGGGEAWRASVRRALGRSSVMVLVASPQALASDNVFEEVSIFSSRHRPLIPIDFGNRVANLAPNHRLYPHLEERLRFEESDEAQRLVNGRPSSELIVFLRRSFGFVPVARRRLMILGLSAICFAVLAGLATASYVAEQSARQSAEAETRRARTEESRLLANVSLQETARGNAVNGMLLALRGLPWNFDSRDRPLVGDTAGALVLAMETQHERVLMRGDEGVVNFAAFSPDGSTVLTSSSVGTAYLWNSVTGQQRVALRGHRRPINAVALSPDVRRVITASDDGTARIWDAVTGKEQLVLRHLGEVQDAAFSYDGARLVTTSAIDHTARLWDAFTGKQIVSISHDTLFARGATAEQEQITKEVSEFAPLWIAPTSGSFYFIGRRPDGRQSFPTLTVSSDGRRVVSAETDNTAIIWDGATGKELVVLRGHNRGVNSASFTSDGRRLLTTSYDATVRVWDVATGSALAVLRGHEDTVNVAAFNHSATRIASASADGSARLWDAANGAELLVLRGHIGEVRSVRFSPDGSHIVTGGNDGTVRVWDTRQRQNVLRGHGEMVFAANFSSDDRRVVTASDDGTARVWDTETATELRSLREPGAGQVLSADFSPGDGLRVVTTSNLGTAQIWNAATGLMLRTLRSAKDAIFTSAVFSPVDGARIVTGSSDGTAQIWDAATGKELLLLHATSSGELHTAEFSPDGRRVVTAADDHTARVWHATSGKQLVILLGHRDRVFSARILAAQV